MVSVALEPIMHAGREVLDNLFELYAHDFSEYAPLVMQASGRFELRVRDVWWSEPGRFAFFLRVAGRLAGFALVHAGSELDDRRDVMDMSEFFVLRAERRQGVGRAAALALFARFPGPWELRVRQANVPAQRFWSRVAAAQAGREVVAHAFVRAGVPWSVLRF